MTLEDMVMEKMANSIASDIDREILWGMLQGMGWTRVMLPRLLDNMHAIDVTCWLEGNCKNNYERSGRDFIFESQQDANWFKLRWGTE
jgi:hypothetical protein